MSLPNTPRVRHDPAIAAGALCRIQDCVRKVLNFDGATPQRVSEFSVNPLSIEEESRFGAEAQNREDFDTFRVRMKFLISPKSTVDNESASDQQWLALGMRTLFSLSPTAIAEASGHQADENRSEIKFKANPEKGTPTARLSLGEVTVDNQETSSRSNWIISLPVAIHLARKEKTEKPISVIDVELNGGDERVSVTALDFKDEFGDLTE